MIHIWNNFIDIIFPPSPAGLIVRNLDKEKICALLSINAQKNITTLSDYSSPTISALITAGKFEHNFKALSLLSELLHKYFDDTWNNQKIIIVPLPLHSSRERWRGYNQSELIAKYAIKKPTDKKIVKLLARHKKTDVQSHLSKQERLTNIKGAFSFINKNIDWTHVVAIMLLDDVYTTGSTMNEARAALAPRVPKNIPLICIAIARA